jgi:hypothetical protein
MGLCSPHSRGCPHPERIGRNSAGQDVMDESTPNDRHQNETEGRQCNQASKSNREEKSRSRKRCGLTSLPLGPWEELKVVEPSWLWKVRRSLWCISNLRPALLQTRRRPSSRSNWENTHLISASWQQTVILLKLGNLSLCTWTSSVRPSTRILT